MNVTVCELKNNWTDSQECIHELKHHLADRRSDMLLLPEMPFFKWLSASDNPDPKLWNMAAEAHESWIEKLNEFGIPLIAGTRPVIKNGIFHNEGFIWDHKTGYHGVHEKYYLPDEEGFREATWYRQGNGNFDLFEINGIRIGFLICTEMWFTTHARDYSKEGIHLLLSPRATPVTSRDTWIAGGTTASVVSGAYCLSSNYNGPNTDSMDFGGAGWIMEPDKGTPLGITTDEKPYVTVEIDLKNAEEAKGTYPRYVKE